MDFRVFRKGEVRRIPLPRTRVNIEPCCLGGCSTCTVAPQVSICSLMRRSAHTRLMRTPSSPLARWGGVAACLGGISYGAYGYFSDNTDMPRFVIAEVGHAGVVPRGLCGSSLLAGVPVRGRRQHSGEGRCRAGLSR